MITIAIVFTVWIGLGLIVSLVFGAAAQWAMGDIPSPFWRRNHRRWLFPALRPK